LRPRAKFKRVVEMMDNKEHLNAEGLAKITSITRYMNKVSLRNATRQKELLDLTPEE
jgi:hypothetical protein